MVGKVRKPKSRGWQALQSGDLVDVIAPASKCAVSELQAGLGALESWGLRVRISSEIFGDSLLHSNSDRQRWLQLKAALQAKDSRAIWCARGGYGSMKLLPSLARLRAPESVKAFLGLSDITSLNVFFNQRWHWPVLHAPILSRVGRGDLPLDSIRELKQVLFGEVSELTYHLEPLNSRAAKTKVLRGRLIGGNWATIMAGLATPYELDPKGNILFLEDVGERGYGLDRFWEQLKQMGFLSQLAAIVFGDFTECNEPDGRNIIWEVLKARAAEFNKPVFHGLPVGHGTIQRVLPLGVDMVIRGQAGRINGSLKTGLL
jgi:muramoyltetrapeptide carboxypeptidase